MKEKQKILFITEDYPSGLNGTSVKTRSTIQYLLKKKCTVDLVCFHFDEFQKHTISSKHLNVHSITTARQNKKSFQYIGRIINLLFSIVPLSIKRLYNKAISQRIELLISNNQYDSVIFDGYSTLQYVHLIKNFRVIYIDDEDFTDLFKQRMQAEQHFLKSIYYFHEYIKSLFFERKSFSMVDVIWAISPNTQKRLARVSGVKTVLMPTVIRKQQNLYNNTGSQIVFTGSLDWRENIEGIKWFLSTHWKTIHRNHPQLQLVIIGQGASHQLVHYFSTYPKVIYKGYVESLESEYKKSLLAIAPVRINAGIKVKILTYMSFGLPVLSTQKASWGLVAKDGVITVSDTSFSVALTKLIQHNSLRLYLSNKAYDNIKNNYSEKKLELFLKKNY